MAWFSTDEGVWEAAVMDLPKPWPEAFARMDLRYHENRHRMKVAPFPGRVAFSNRWGWTDRKVRNLLEADDWHDSARPVAREDLRGKWDGIRQHAANTLPTPRPTVCQQDNKPTPVVSENPPTACQQHVQQSANSMSIARVSSLTTENNEEPRNHGDAPASGTLFVFAKPEPPTPQALALPAPKQPTTNLEALWSALTAWTPKPAAWKLTAERRKHLAARVADHGEATVYRVAEWVRTSQHDRAAFLRGHGDVDTLLRPSKFATYAAFSEGPVQQPVRNGRPVAPSYEDTRREIEEMERATTTRNGTIDAAYEVLQ
jgi:hypothetical protein